MSLFKPPTRDELQTIKETEHLFGSNLLKLQISELLSEVSQNSYPTELNELLISVKDLIKNLPCSDRVKLCEGLSLLPDSVKYPLRFTPPSDLKGYFQFYPPKSVNIVGSFQLKTQLSNCSVEIDLCVRLPEECLQPKDILNYRYHHKRALYLSLIAGHCVRSSLFQSVLFRAQNPLFPVIVLTPKEYSNCSIIIHTAIPNGYFPLHKLHPDRNNVRLCEGTATPHYNGDLVFEMNSKKRHLEEIYTSIEECPNICKAIILYKIWSKQREFNKKLGCFSSFLFSMLMVYLLRQRKISSDMSSYQLLIVSLKFIADTDISSQGIAMMDRKAYPTLPSIEVYHSYYDVVFVDNIGNMCAHMSKQQYDYMRDEASASIMLCFDSLFLKPLPMLMKFDGIIRIDLSNIQQIKESCLLGSINEWVWPTPGIAKNIVAILQNGFKDRLKLIAQDGYTCTQWSVSDDSPFNTSSQLTLGVLYNPDSIYECMTIGPEADSDEAKQFRSFWGDLSEMRRFQDGTIHEAVLWNDHIRASIPHQILIHLLSRHANITTIPTNMNNSLESIISHDAHHYNENIVKSYNELRGILCSIKGLPLSISTVKCSSSAASHSEIPCLRPSKNVTKSNNSSNPMNNYSAFCEIIIQLESTNKWPFDVQAIRHLTALFNIELHQALLKQYKLSSKPTEEYIDIIKSDIVFRVRIYNHVLLELLKKHHIPSCDQYQFVNVYKPQLTSFLAGVQGVWPSYGGSARLCKKWISCHLLSNHFADEIIELILVSLYINPEPYQVSSSPVVMFYRFLSLLTSHDWSHDPLVINIDGSLSDGQVATIKKQYTRARSDYPSMGVVSHYDLTSSWTRDKPVYTVLRRLVALASATLTFIQENVFNQSVNIKQIFQPSFAEYDCVIHLNSTRTTQQISSCDLIGQYLSVLKENFSEFALLFYDKYGSDKRIAVLWKPIIRTQQSFKPQNGYCLVKHKDYYKIDVKSIISDMTILGEGIVEKIEQTSSF